MRRCLLSLLIAQSLWIAQPISAQNTTAASGTPTATIDKPLAELPYTPGLDVSALDTTASPCDNFYQFSCGGWIKNNPIPEDQARWSVYGKLYQDNQRFLWGILDTVSRKTSGNSTNQQKIGDYFAACMNADAVEQLGAAPLKPLLDDLDAMHTKADLPATLARMHLATAGNGMYFGFGSEQDFSNASQVIAFATGGGISLPDRDYYTKTDTASIVLRAKYQAHVAAMFVLAGDTPQAAHKNAALVMRTESTLAKASLSVVDKRDPYKLFNSMPVAELQGLTPGFDWHRYLQALGMGQVEVVNVTEPAFYRALTRHWKASSLMDIKIYLRWHVLHSQASLLSSAFVNENFRFFAQTLRGTPQLQPRWKRCVALVDAQLGEALGQEFVDRAFGPELKQRTLHMTEQIEQAMHDEVQQLDWMSPATKRKAIQKLKAIVNKIGYPDTWRDYSDVQISRGDFYGNVSRATQFEARRQLNKISKPLDRGEWSMTPPTVNAYYSAQMNDINFPAGVLQPPLFDPKMDDAPGYGNTGGTIGHELIHGFDDEGRQFDAQGNLKDWWTSADRKQFRQRAQCIVDQYAKYVVVDNIKINSQLTLGEDMADLGGLVLAWMAWKVQTTAVTPESRDGFTPEQRFFIGFAQWACENNRPEDLRVQAATDPHSPGKYRVNGVVVNLPEFSKAFACKPGSAMVAAKPCRIW
ncbi:MAG: M13 family metallopeptidase [Burkholderiales bacterium]|nr:M13 family metallopeptidase [Burkholderiales bacterium]